MYEYCIISDMCKFLLCFSNFKKCWSQQKLKYYMYKCLLGLSLLFFYRSCRNLPDASPWCSENKVRSCLNRFCWLWKISKLQAVKKLNPRTSPRKITCASNDIYIYLPLFTAFDRWNLSSMAHFWLEVI